MLGFGPLSVDPISTLPRLTASFDVVTYVWMRATPPVEFLTGDPTKRLVFTVEIDVLPLLGEEIPTFGDET